MGGFAFLFLLPRVFPFLGLGALASLLLGELLPPPLAQVVHALGLLLVALPLLLGLFLPIVEKAFSARNR